MTTIYGAVMKAADHIERNPGEFDFRSTRIPTAGCGAPGCALGWVASFAGLRRVWEASKELVCPGAPGHYDGEFYDRMNKLGPGWDDDAAICASTLRAYAAKYLKPSTPDWEALAAQLATAPRISEAA